MPFKVSIDQVESLAPSLQGTYRQGFIGGQGMLDVYGISTTPVRIAHFMAQVLHESGALTMLDENLHYSAARLVQVWPSRFLPRGPLDPQEYAYNERKLGNVVYGGRMGNTGPDDGYHFRGRGLLQLTGRDGYAQATRLLRVQAAHVPDFTEDPDAVLAPMWCVGVAAADWALRGCNELADADDLEQVTRRINGGLLGLEDRRKWLEAAKAVWCGDGAM
jgi:putative chitinase